MKSRWLRGVVKVGPFVFLALGLSGCLSIKSEGATQRAPGVVTLGGVVCGSDYNADSYPGCDDSNVAETDNRAHTGCDADHGPTDPVGCGLAGDGQLLVGFRVPLGSEGPPTFTSDVRDLHFEQSPSYTLQLQKKFPAPSDQHWVGYISDVRTFATGKAAEEPTGIHPEFTLPTERDGSPFSRLYRWRWVVGFRNITKAHAGDPVECGGIGDLCVDSPPQERVATDLPPENVSDFGVVGPAASASVAQTRTATLTFKVRFADARRLGARDFALTASTTVPGTTAQVGVSTIRAESDSATTVNVQVPVPLGTPTGSYDVALTARTGAPPVTRSSTATLVVEPPPDSDGDELADPFDKCPSTARGGFDADNDGCVGPYAEITSTPTGTWTVSNAGLRIGSMRLPSVPIGARVSVSCKPCRVKQTLTATQSTLNLPKLSNKLLRRNQGFTVTVTHPGFVGEQVTLTVKRFGKTRRAFVKAAKRPFRKQRRCVPVGSSAPARTCSATPPIGP